jgi:uncharacterized membrane protein
VNSGSFDDLPTAGHLELPPFVDVYYRQVCSDVEIATDASDPCGTNQHPTWPDLYRLEVLSLKARSEEELRRSAWAIRLRFRNIAGEGNYQAYLASIPPDPATASRDQLLADLQTLLRRTYYLLILLPVSERVRQRLLRYAAVVGSVCVGAIIAIAFLGGHLLLFAVALLAGAIGGTMSLVQRLLQLNDADPLILRMSDRAAFIQSAIIPPISGAIFSALLFMLFASGILKGPLFPEFIPSAPANTHTIMPMMLTLAPANAQQGAMLLVWSFVAGFAERFAPNTISRLLQKQESGENSIGPRA